MAEDVYTPTVGDRVQAKNDSAVGSTFRNLIGTVTGVHPNGQAFWINFDATGDDNGGTWRPRHVRLLSTKTDLETRVQEVRDAANAEIDRWSEELNTAREELRQAAHGRDQFAATLDYALTLLPPSQQQRVFGFQDGLIG